MDLRKRLGVITDSKKLLLHAKASCVVKFVTFVE